MDVIRKRRRERVRKRLGEAMKKIWFIRLVRYDREIISEFADEVIKSPSHNFDFYGVGIGGWYVGFFNMRLKKRGKQ